MHLRELTHSKLPVASLVCTGKAVVSPLPVNFALLAALLVQTTIDKPFLNSENQI